MSLISVLARNRLRHENRSHFIAACCYATRPSMRRAPTQKMRAAKAPTVPEGASEAEANEIRLKVQQDHLRMIEKEAERGNQRRVNVNSVNVPLLGQFVCFEPTKVLDCEQCADIFTSSPSTSESNTFPSFGPAQYCAESMVSRGARKAQRCAAVSTANYMHVKSVQY